MESLPGQSGELAWIMDWWWDCWAEESDLAYAFSVLLDAPELQEVFGDFMVPDD